MAGVGHAGVLVEYLLGALAAKAHVLVSRVLYVARGLVEGQFRRLGLELPVIMPLHRYLDLRHWGFLLCTSPGQHMQLGQPIKCALVKNTLCVGCTSLHRVHLGMIRKNCLV